jgi:hypothetical protein
MLLLQACQDTGFSCLTFLCYFAITAMLTWPKTFVSANFTGQL